MTLSSRRLLWFTSEEGCGLSWWCEAWTNPFPKWVTSGHSFLSIWVKPRCPEHWTADQRMRQLTHSRASNGHELPKETSSRMPSMILWAHFKQEASQVMYERQWQPGFSSSPCTLEQLVTSGWQTQYRIRCPCLVLGDSGMWDVKLNSVSVAQDVKLISVLSLEHLIFEFKGYEPKT